MFLAVFVNESDEFEEIPLINIGINKAIKEGLDLIPPQNYKLLGIRDITGFIKRRIFEHAIS